MAAQIHPGQDKTPCIERKLDLGSHFLCGPLSFSNMTALYEEVAAETTVVAFPTGESLSYSEFQAFGTISLVTADGKAGIVLNGESANPVASFEDSEGVYTMTSVEILDGCCAWVNICIPYRAREVRCEFVIDGEQICIDGEELEIVAAVGC